MVQHDRRLREGARQIDDVRKLSVEQPRVEAEPERGEPSKSLAEISVTVKALRRTRAVDRKARIGVPGRAVADALEAAAGYRDMLLENALGAAANPQIDIADDAGDAARGPVLARRTHRRDAVDELGLTDRLLLLRAIGPVHFAAFFETGRDDIVTAANVFQQILEQVTVTRPVPQVMVRIDNWQIR